MPIKLPSCSSPITPALEAAPHVLWASWGQQLRRMPRTSPSCSSPIDRAANDQGFEDPYGGVQHGRDENALEKYESQKVRQIDVSENICEERRWQNDKPD